MIVTVKFCESFRENIKVNDKKVQFATPTGTMNHKFNQLVQFMNDISQKSKLYKGIYNL